MLLSIAVLVLGVSMTRCISNDLPDYFPRCHINDPNINSCLVKAFNTVRPYVAKGVPELGILPFESLTLPTVSWTQNNPGRMEYTAVAWNYTIEGLDSYNVKEIRYDPQTLAFTTKVRFDSISLSAIYELSGLFFHIPTEGNGILRGILQGPINAAIKLKGDLKYIDAVEYYNPTEIKVSLKLGDGHFNLAGICKRNETIGRMINDKINRSILQLLQDATPEFERIAETQIMGFLQTFTRSIPYYKIFPL